jgi:hypothetical protein
MLEMSMVGLLIGSAGSLGVPTTYVRDIDGGPLGSPRRFSLHLWS